MDRMRTRSSWLFSCMLVLGLLAMSGASLAQTSLTNQGVELLDAVQRAAKTLNYQGTYAHQRNGEMRAFRVSHAFDGQDEAEKLEVLDDTPREYIRKNNIVQCLLPEQKLVLIESQRQERFPALLMSNVPDFVQFYDLVVGENTQRVAGRKCINVSIKPKDGHRPHYELCVDKQTGLLLEAQMLDRLGSVLEHIAFTDIDINVKLDDAALSPSWPVSQDQWRVVRRHYDNVDLAAEGWFYQTPPGYKPVVQVQQTLANGRQVSQVVLTDGLATLSIFIEPYQQKLSEQLLVGAKRSGAVNLFGKRVDSFWVVVAGEASPQTVRHLAESVVRTGPLHTR